MPTVYPKVLIVGQCFDKKAGGGITMINLFKGWDIKSIAVAAESIDNPDFKVCNNYYQLGTLEYKQKFPFKINPWKQPTKSGPLSKEEQQKTSHGPSPSNNSNLKNLYKRIVSLTGYTHYRRRYQISNKLLNWIEEFSPDWIYCQLSTLELILFVKELNKELQIPIAVHIMDDWPSTISRKGILQKYWHNQIDTQFRKLLSSATLFMSISEAMSKEYQLRYGYTFIPFHNPIDIKFWGNNPKISYDINTPFRIVYTGRIGTGIQNCFFSIAEAIKNLIEKGLKIEFHIYSAQINTIINDISKFNFVKPNNFISHSELPQLFSKTDLLLLPNDFDERSISFLKYSMPSKASEYMVSGTPILLYASSEAAVTAHALKYNWAYVVSEKSSDKLEKAITEIYHKKELRMQLGTKAKEFAKNQYDGTKIRELFRNAFNQN